MTTPCHNLISWALSKIPARRSPVNIGQKSLSSGITGHCRILKLKNTAILSQIRLKQTTTNQSAGLWHTIKERLPDIGIFMANNGRAQ
ncbi:hypothetical protein EOPP23_09685 [Endozoicomonas sp. OPT23]|nr:hypothetical protein [Endozoicomonas sp. OPT23]